MRGLGRTLRTVVGLQWRAAPLASALAAGMAIMSGLAAAVGGWFMRELIDEVARGTDGSSGRATALVIAAAATVGGATAIGHLNVYLNELVRWRVTAAVESTLFKKIAGLVGLRELETPSFQSKLRLAQQAALEAPQQLSHLTLAIITAAAAIASSIVAVWLVMPSMVWILLLAASLELVTQVYCSRQHAALTKSLVETHRWRDYHRTLLVDLHAAKEIRLYGLKELLLARLLGGPRRTSGRELRLARKTMVIRSGLALMASTITVFGAVAVVRGAFAGRLHVGDVALFLAAVAGIQAATSSLFWELGGTARSVIVFQNYVDIIELPEPVATGTGAVPPLRTAIELRDVWFRYSPDGPWVLRGLNLRIPARGTLGLVGINGAGKSTLVKMLCRFWEPEHGQVLWDGIDIRDLDPEALRVRIAATFQDFMTYDATAAENIAFGDVRHRDDLSRIRAAAETSGIDEKLLALPAGYQTLLSRTLAPSFEADQAADVAESGVTLSGGEWQRVALARSLFRPDADLLILDEPSSGLDAGAEFRLNRAIQRHARGKTRLLISHRLSALREADQIAVLEHGQIVEQGTHDELMIRRGAYAALFSLQASGYQDTRLMPAGSAEAR